VRSRSAAPFSGRCSRSTSAKAASLRRSVASFSAPPSEKSKTARQRLSREIAHGGETVGPAMLGWRGIAHAGARRGVRLSLGSIASAVGVVLL
jgi:hypothetical protein